MRNAEWVQAGGGTALASASARITAGNYTTTSTTFVNVDATNLNFTITTVAHRVMITLVATGAVRALNLGAPVDGAGCGPRPRCSRAGARSST